MDKLKNVWVVAADSAVAELTAGAKTLGENVVLVYAGDRQTAVNADKAYYLGVLGTEASFVNYIPAIVSVVKEAAPELILLDSSKNGRLVGSCLAAAFCTSVQSDASEVSILDGRVCTKRMAYGGGAVKTEVSGATAVVCVGAGVFEASENTAVAEVCDLENRCDERIRFIKKNEKTEENINLSAAKYVVGVGRGLSEESDMELCENFAKVIGAELGCSRPVSEEKKWLPSARYIGVSGAMIKPEVYMAIGISGQIQHVVGINDSGTIIAVNKDESAAIFKYCDYGIVGDLRKIIPALCELMK